MRVLLVGAGGVGTAIARTAARWNLFERVVVADYDVARAQRAAAAGERFRAVHLDAGEDEGGIPAPGGREVRILLEYAVDRGS